MAIYDGKAVAKGHAMPDGRWSWQDFGLKFASPGALAEFCPESELVKARTLNPAFSEWLGDRTGNDGEEQKATVARNAVAFDQRTLQGANPTLSGSIRCGFSEDD